MATAAQLKAEFKTRKVKMGIKPKVVKSPMNWFAGYNRALNAQAARKQTETL